MCFSTVHVFPGYLIFYNNTSPNSVWALVSQNLIYNLAFWLESGFLKDLMLGAWDLKFAAYWLVLLLKFETHTLGFVNYLTCWHPLFGLPQKRIWLDVNPVPPVPEMLPMCLNPCANRDLIWWRIHSAVSYCFSSFGSYTTVVLGLNWCCPLGRWLCVDLLEL